MDIFKQKTYLVVTVIILIILNLGILTMLWINKPDHPKFPNHIADRPNEQEQISILLRQELEFTDEQIEEYLHLRRINREQMSGLENEIRDLKRQMFNKVILENSDLPISDSLLSMILDKQGQIEKLTYQHFLDLNQLCDPGQQNKLQLLIHRLLPPPGRRQESGHLPPPHDELDNRPPPPPKRDI